MQTIKFLTIAITLQIFSICLFAQGLVSYDTSASYAGYTLFPNQNKAYLIDNCGKLINEWTFNNIAALSANLMPNGNIFWMGGLSPNTFLSGGGSSGNLEIRDPNNNLVWSYAYYAANDFGIHHDSEILPNGNILLIVWEELTTANAISLGRVPANISQNRLWITKIVELQPVGTNQINTVWEWHGKDHLTQDYDPNLSNYGVISENPQLLDINIGGSQRDWLHCNGIDYNADLDQIVISAKHISEVFIIDHSTTTEEAASHSGGNYGKGGDFLYRWGNPQNYQRGNSADKILSGQHDVRWIRKGFTNEGAITVFNNKGVSNSQSSIEMFFPPMDSLGYYTQPLNNTIPFGPTSSSYTLTNGPGGSFYTGIKGGVESLPNGNVLICNSTTLEFWEMDLNENIVWEYDFSLGSGCIFKMNRYLASDVELSNINLAPGNTIENPSSSVSTNCGPIVYTPFCFVNYTGLNELIGEESNNADYETDGIIESNQIINAGAVVDYDSNTEILLKAGFEVKANADFYAFIDGCNDGLGGLN